MIVQPAARLTTRLVDDAEFKLDGFLGTWNSFGPNGGTQTGALVEDWYESDFYAGFTLSHGKLSLTTSYIFLTSPSDAFQTVQELGFTLALDDSDWMKAWALKPYATLAIETGSNGSDGPELDNGAYLELGIAPGFSFDMGKTPVTLTFPTSVGLSLSDYYQDAGGSDGTFGFAQIGAKASIPLGESLKLARSTPNSWSESLGNVQVLLEARIAREGAKAADLSIALTHLNRGRTQVEAELARVAAGPPKREGRTGARITEYRVESFDGQETLTEYRGPMTEPFRTPHAVYAAVVKFAAGRKDPFDFMLLFDTLRKSLGELPDYRVRVCTRFMVAAGVLRHERRRFIAADGPKGFSKAAAEAWSAAAKSPLIPPAR